VAVDCCHVSRFRSGLQQEYCRGNYRDGSYRNRGGTRNHLQLSTGELNGEGCNDAIYNRSVYLEEFYNVEFVETICEGNIDPKKVMADITAGDASQDMIYADLASHGSKMVLAGTMYPSDMIPGLQLDRPYWSQEMRESLTIGDSFYFPTGAITPRYYGSAFMLMFNRDIITDMNLTNPHELTLEGKWTIDAMFELSTDAYVDLNGSGKLDPGDQVGFGYGNTTAEALILGCGYHYAQNDNGKMKLNFDVENLVTLMQWMVQPVIYDQVIILKNTRDEASAQIVDKLFENVTVELTTIINPGGLYDKLKAMFTTELGKTEITTLYAANRANVENFFTDLEATFAEYRRSLE